MGWRPRLKLNRTAASFLLTAIAVAVPTAAWFLAGQRELEREAHLEEKGLYHQSYKKAVELAERLSSRLEQLRQSEARRPFYHFQNLFHDPKGAAEGASVSLSPLAQGSADPLIDAYFQVDEAGRLTLPTLNDEFPELSLYTDEAEQCTLLTKLEEVSFFCTLETGQLPYLPRLPGGRNVGDGDVADGVAGHPLVGHVEVMSERAWRQHLRANALYADLKYGKKPAPALELAAPAVRDREVEIEVSPYSWHTIPVGNRPSLVALRSVDTPAGVWTQGFVISRRAVAQSLENSSYPAAFVPRDRAGGGEQVVAAVDGTPWGVALDLSKNLAATVDRVEDERERFLGVFFLGALAAAVAGLLVVAMVHQSERLAHQRAQFAASAAHELRTPLAGLRLYGEMLAEGLGNPTRARDYARRLAGEAERLGRVVTNVLSFTRLERGVLAVDPRPGDLLPAVRDAVERQRPALEESGARLELALPDDLPAVVFDRDAVAHILQNLLDNAEKYTRDVDDRTIRISLYRAPLKRQGDGVAVVVADNGHGIPPRLRRRLFRPFTRGEHRDAPEGLGLGLVLVKMLARAQGGEIDYHDAPGGGAVFTVTLPAA